MSKRVFAKPIPRKAQGPDGHTRPIEQEQHLNELMMLVFRDEGPQEILRYLRNLTTNRALKPPFDSLELAHLEGARWLMAVIEQRIKLGQRGEPKLRPEGNDE